MGDYVSDERGRARAMRMRTNRRMAEVARAGDMAAPPRGWGQSGPAVVFVFVSVAIPIDGGGSEGMVGLLPPTAQANEIPVVIIPAISVRLPGEDACTHHRHRTQALPRPRGDHPCVRLASLVLKKD